MKQQEMKHLIFEMLSGILAETDFRLKKSESAFVRKIPGGKQCLGLPLWDFNPQFEFSLTIYMRLESVAEIFNQFSGAAPKYHSMGTTIITLLDQYTKGPTRFKVTAPNDVAQAGIALSPIIRGKILPFFHGHVNMEALDKSVNWQVPGIDITQNPAGAMNSVIIARLARNPNFDQLVARRRAELQVAVDADYPFNHLVSYLKTL